MLKYVKDREDSIRTAWRSVMDLHKELGTSAQPLIVKLAELQAVLVVYKARNGVVGKGFHGK